MRIAVAGSAILKRNTFVFCDGACFGWGYMAFRTRNFLVRFVEWETRLRVIESRSVFPIIRLVAAFAG